MVIQTPDQRLRIFVSSTMKELGAERAAVRAAIERLRLTPVLFELGARPHPPRELYLAYIRQSHVFLGIYGREYGWVAPGMDVSGLEDEYLAAAGMPKLVYVRRPAPDRDPRLAGLLERIGSDGLSYRGFSDPEELAALVVDDLAVLVSERFATPEPPVARRLPAPISSFVGRAGELADLQTVLLDPGSRLVTLTGPGGIGKTRLAMEAAVRCADRFADGAAAVLLASVQSVRLVPDAIRTALGIPEVPGRSPAEAVVDYLAGRKLLLLLDNVEHVIAAADLVANLLRAAPDLKVLATSREVLRISGEQVIVVPPLSEAVELFLDRARAARHDLRVDEEQLRVVGEIARRLEGLPLAIELAAARVRLLEPDDILRRLDQRLALLSGGPRDLPERQRTLRATLRWSYDLLDEPDRKLLAHLSVFAGGFTLAAAEAVWGDGDLLEGLGSLVDRSLLRPDGSTLGMPRFAMLMTIAEFGREQLAAGEAEQVGTAHATFFLRLTLDHEAGLATGEGQGLIPLYLAEQDNVRTAMRWWLDRGQPDPVARMGLALWRFWWIRGLFSEGIHWMEEVLAAEPSLTGEAATHARFVLGMLAFGRGDYDRAAQVLAEASTRYQDAGDTRGLAMSSIGLGVIRGMSDYGFGKGVLERAIAALRGLDDRSALVLALFSLGGVELLHDRPAAAVPPLEESVERARGAGTDVLLGHALVHLGLARLRLGELERAGPLLWEALQRAEEVDSRETVARALEALTQLAIATDEPERAALLFGAAQGVRQAVGAHVWGTDRASHDRTAAALDEALGERARATIARGADLPLEQVLGDRPTRPTG